MDLKDKKPLQNFIDKAESTSSASPPPPTAAVATTSATQPPPSPESTWSFSPLPTPSHPSLLYQCIASLRRDGNIYSLSLSKTGLLFTGSTSTRIRAWSRTDLVERGKIKAPYGEVRSIISHNNTLFTSHKDNKIRVWTLTETRPNFRPKKTATLPKTTLFKMFGSNPNQHKDTISCMAYYKGEGILYSGSYDNTVKAWKVSERRCLDTFVAHGENVNDIAINEEDGCVFTCSNDGSIKIWRRAYLENFHTLITTLKFQPSAVNALAVSGGAAAGLGNSLLYSGCSDGFINFWEKETLSCRYNHGGFLQGHRFAVLTLVTLDALVISGSEDKTIRIWRREQEGNYYGHECLAVLEGHRGPVRCLAACLETGRSAMTAGGISVFSASLDQTFKVWRVKGLPEMKASHTEDGNGNNNDNNNNNNNNHNNNIVGESDVISPVLSPSWVEKKLFRGTSY